MVKNGLNWSTKRSRTFNAVENGQYGQNRTKTVKNGRKWSITVKNGWKQSETAKKGLENCQKWSKTVGNKVTERSQKGPS